MKYHFLGRKKALWFTISGIIIAGGVFALIYWKLPFGLDFKGGTQLEITAAKNPTSVDLSNKINSIESGKGATVTATSDGAYLVKLSPLSLDKKKSLYSELQKDYGTITEKSADTVGPTISGDLTRKSIYAVVFASLLIIFYLAYSFRSVIKPVSSWQFGITAVAALLHDLVVTVGIYAILAHYFGWEVDATFIPALLTVMGFSVHDTIVVFDRIRENLITHKNDLDLSFEHTADISLDQTLNRSLATSLTVIFTLLTLVLLGGSTIRPFVATLLVGITIGTYSSIFTATPLLVVWQNSRAKHETK